MLIVRPYAKILTSNYTEDCLKKIEYAARISHRSEDDMKEDSAERFLQAVVMKRGDWSVTEHISVSVEMVVDRGITHEIVRHRLASYTQESTRFVNYAKKMPPAFIYPKPDVECSLCLEGVESNWSEKDQCNLHCVEDQNSRNIQRCELDPTWVRAIHKAEHAYRRLLEKGWRPQEARSVFPNALAAKILVTMNLRSWRHFFLMRTTKEAHPQIRQVTIPLLKEFQTLIPVLYNDIEPESSQMANITKGR